MKGVINLALSETYGYQPKEFLVQLQVDKEPVTLKIDHY